MGEVIVTANDGQQLSFEIAGDAPTPFEGVRIRKALREYGARSGSDFPLQIHLFAPLDNKNN